MKAAIVLCLGTNLAIASPNGPATKPEPKANKRFDKVAVCPHLPPTHTSAFWDNEELWPACPVGSPISSSGGRCLDGTTTCMRPCASKISGGGIDDSATYTYDASGRLVSATLTRSFEGSKPEQTTNTCKRDKDGHRTSCTSWNGEEETYQYKDGALAGTLTTKDGKTNGTSTVKRDENGRVVATTWQLGWLGPYENTMAYNADGTLARYISKNKIRQTTTTTTFTYAKGRLVKTLIKSEGGGRSTATEITYTDDAAGRVTHEKFTGYGTGTYTYSYDAEGRLVSQRADNGVTTTYQYTRK
jgi:YD repeat-containing protein